MRILIVYGSTEGHTAELSRFVARCLTDLGDDVTTRDAASESCTFDLQPFDAIFLAASLHVGHYQSAVVQFARENHEALKSCCDGFHFSLLIGCRRKSG